jgi:hypothetical protein
MAHRPSKRYDELRKEMTHIDGAGELIAYLEDRTDWLTSPASMRYHGSYVGGLVDHSVDVVDIALGMKSALEERLEKEIEGRVELVGLFHDVGKVGLYIREGSRSRVWYFNEKVVAMPHSVRSLYVISRFVVLSEVEWQAIYAHNGQYVEHNKEIAMKEAPLTLLLHMADVWAARIGR